MRAGTAAAALAAVGLAAAGCGGSSEPRSRTLADRLQQALLAHDSAPRWVACVPTRFRFVGRTAYRCNVNFGDPHVEAYCAVLDGDRFVYAAWRQPDQGRQDRIRAQRECVSRLG